MLKTLSTFHLASAQRFRLLFLLIVMQATVAALQSTDGSFIDANNAKQMPSRRNAVAYIWRTLRAGFGNTAPSELMKRLIVEPPHCLTYHIAVRCHRSKPSKILTFYNDITQNTRVTFRMSVFGISKVLGEWLFSCLVVLFIEISRLVSDTTYVYNHELSRLWRVELSRRLATMTLQQL